MRNPTSISLAAILVLAGCAAGPRSSTGSTWATVRAARLGFHAGSDGSEAFADHLASVLKAERVPHKVVTYEFRYRTPANEEAIATRTAVLYRDGNDPRNPWWLMEDRLRTPVWVPGEDHDHQVSFYLRRRASIVSVNGKPLGDGKRQIADAPVVSAPRIARLLPIRPTERSRSYAKAGQAHRTHTISPKDIALFRARHGSVFDPSSVADRLKMDRLMNGARRSVAGR